jgi:hypothetical protein
VVESSLWPKRPLRVVEPPHLTTGVVQPPPKVGLMVAESLNLALRMHTLLTTPGYLTLVSIGLLFAPHAIHNPILKKRT